MKKTAFLLVSLVCTLAFSAYAEDTTNGYVMSIYGNSLKGAYGDCVHTAYYNPDTDGRTECGDAKTVASAPEMKAQKVIETITINDADNVLFNFNAASLTSAGTTAIAAFGKKLGSQPDIVKVTIDGYTDAIGKPEYNKKLSINRANAVKQFFVQNGVPENIIATNGYGEDNAKVSASCVSKFGDNNLEQIWQIETKLSSSKYKSKNKATVKEKKRLQNQLNSLKSQHDRLIACTAPDRRVVFTIEHNQKVEKTVMVRENSSDSIKALHLEVPPIESGDN